MSVLTAAGEECNMHKSGERDATPEDRQLPPSENKAALTV